MTFKDILLKTGQLIFSIAFILFLAAFVGFTVKVIYKMYLFGYNLL